MSFAFPTAFLWFLLALPIVFFYILKIRMRRVETSTTMFWNQIYDEKPPRSIWEFLRHLLSLAAQLLLVTLLVLALADPYFHWQVQGARKIVLVIDQSASMQAQDISPSRFAAAIEAAQNVVQGLRERDQMAILSAREHPEILCSMTGHQPTLKQTLMSLRPEETPTQLKPAVQLAERLIGEKPNGEIIVLTDACAEGVESLTESKRVQLRSFGTSASNVGITRFQVRRSLIDPLGYEALVSIRNAGNSQVELRLDLDLSDSPVDVIPLTLQPDEVWTRSIEKTSLEGGILTARLTQIRPKDGGQASSTGHAEAGGVNMLTTDDQAWSVLPARVIQNVLLISPDKNLFLRKVLEANPLVKLTVATELPEQWPVDSVIVLHQKLPEVLPPGKLWVIDPLTSSNLWKQQGDLENPIITEIDKVSPLMTHVNLDNVLIPKARKLTFEVPVRMLAGAVSGEPVYAEISQAAHKTLVLPVSLEEGDLTFRTAFPILATNALNWFAGGAGELQPALETGSATRLSLPEVSEPLSHQVQVRSPNGQTRLVPVQHSAEASTLSQPEQGTGQTSHSVQNRMISVGPLQQTGLWRVRSISAGEGKDSVADSPSLLEFACNLANDRETDLRTPLAYQQQAQPTLLQAGWFSRPFWFYLVALSALLMSVEWWLYQRRLIR